MPPTPELSVVIATYNRRQMLRRCLDSLAAQSVFDTAGGAPAQGRSIEVIVVDDGSADGTAAMLAELAAGSELPFALRPISQANGGQAVALNAGIEAAASPLCLVMDDDLVASPALLATHLAAHRAEGDPVLAVGSLTQQPVDGNDWYAHAFASSWNHRHEELTTRGVFWSDCYGANFSVPTAILRQVGGFDAKLPCAYDLELAFRLHRAGCEPIYLAEAHAVHDDQKGWQKLLADQQRYGAFCPTLVADAPEMRGRLINWFAQPTPRDVTLRRAMMTLRVPPSLLVRAGRLIPGAGRKQIWFGFVSRYAFWRAVRGALTRRQWVRTSRGAAVLMYHAFSAAEEGDRYVISARRFERQMRLLKLLRRNVVSFDALVEMLRDGTPIPDRTVVLTIDDGYLDNLEIAHPILRRRRFPATIFLVSERLSRSNEWDSEGAVAGRPIVSAEQVREMRAAGVEFGAHTRTHCSLPDVGDDQVRDEIAGSRTDLEAVLGEPVRNFAYPFGRYDERAEAAVREAGYEGACTVEAGFVFPGTDPLAVPRLEIEGTDSTLRFLLKLAFGSV